MVDDKSIRKHHSLSLVAFFVSFILFDIRYLISFWCLDYFATITNLPASKAGRFVDDLTPAKPVIWID